MFFGLWPKKHEQDPAIKAISRRIDELVQSVKNEQDPAIKAISKRIRHGYIGGVVFPEVERRERRLCDFISEHHSTVFVCCCAYLNVVHVD